MERVTGFDAAFLALETPTMHMHIAAVMVFEPGDDGAGPEPAAVQFQRLRQLVSERLHLVPPLRRRVVRVPFGLHHPVWLEDPDFDLDYHLRRAHLPAPGGPAELQAFVADVAGRPLDPQRPLWEMHLVEGLDSGHTALVVKIHHAAIDGTSGAEVLATFLDLGPVPRAVPAPIRPWRPEPIPTEAEMLTWAATSLVRQPERAFSALRRTVGAVRDLADHNRRLRAEHELSPPPAPFSAPRSSLNGAISAHRRFAMAEMALDDVRLVKDVFGGTVNDVVLAVVSGALRRLLGGRGEDVDASLVAFVPISSRTEADRGKLGNKVSGMLVSLASTVEDPVERLWAVSAASQVAKEQARALPEELLHTWAQLAAPAVSSRVARLSANMRVFDRVRPLFNVVVSNIAGPDASLWCAGSRMVALYPMGPLIEGVGLNVTVASYDTTVFFGALGCRELVPEVEYVTEYLEDALGELVKAASRGTIHRGRGSGRAYGRRRRHPSERPWWLAPFEDRTDADR
ncbi:MAG TPA: wax ester/triacylglycerol synthase family O-acyltransferase [Acidimicrobiales bacterium]|nr:wax ester/triacylglycerol synthase family O-acyltransferase [Acidimicrobiales bacterium]